MSDHSTESNADYDRGESGVEPPLSSTGPCRRYFDDFLRLMGFVGFVSHLAAERDESARIAARLLHKGEDDPERLGAYEQTMEVGVGAVHNLKTYRQLLLQLVVTHGVDSFLLYVAELLALIFETRPETLKSGDQVRLDLILQHSSMEDLVSMLAERKVQELSYQGMADLADWLDSRLGLTLFESRADAKRAIHTVELRNLIVHNRGVVNRLFLDRVPDFPGASLGTIIKLDVDAVFDDLDLIAKSIKDVDARAADKFGLPMTARDVDDT